MCIGIVVGSLYSGHTLGPQKGLFCVLGYIRSMAKDGESFGSSGTYVCIHIRGVSALEEFHYI